MVRIKKVTFQNIRSVNPLWKCPYIQYYTVYIRIWPALRIFVANQGRISQLERKTVQGSERNHFTRKKREHRATRYGGGEWTLSLSLFLTHADTL
jgi:hypothetical protein